MISNRHAVIDVGTNSVKLLVADVHHGAVQPVEEASDQTRLGKGFYQTHRLQPAAIQQTAATVAGFAKRARDLQTGGSLRVIATSAARDATNAAELTEAIRRIASVQVEILSGDEEADWVFRGVSTDPRLQGHPLLILDVGGGSTEFILGQGTETHYRNSFKLGTVRLLETLSHSDPPTPQERDEFRRWVAGFMDREVKPALAGPLHQESGRQPVRLVGTGGTSTILARLILATDRFDRDRIEGVEPDLELISHWADRLWSVSLEERERFTGLPAKRADVILTGVLIYESIMRTFQFPNLHISTRGLRWAAILEAASRPEICPSADA